MTFTSYSLTIPDITVSSINASTLNSSLSNINTLFSATDTSNCVCIPSGGTISFDNHTFSAEELGTLLYYLQQLYPESQI